jgi:hypothetical protein
MQRLTCSGGTNPGIDVGDLTQNRLQSRLCNMLSLVLSLERVSFYIGRNNSFQPISDFDLIPDPGAIVFSSSDKGGHEKYLIPT